MPAQIGYVNNRKGKRGSGEKGSEKGVKKILRKKLSEGSESIANLHKLLPLYMIIYINVCIYKINATNKEK